MPPLGLTRRLGNVGILTGPPFFAAIAEYMNGTNQLAIQGVDYPAEITGFLEGGSPIGVAVLCVAPLSLSLAVTDIFSVKSINHTLAACPNTPLLRCIVWRSEEWDCDSRHCGGEGVDDFSTGIFALQKYIDQVILTFMQVMIFAREEKTKVSVI